MKRALCLLFVLLLLIPALGTAQVRRLSDYVGKTGSAGAIIPPDKFPKNNSRWNLNNTAIYFTDGRYFFVNGGDGNLYRLTDQLQLGQKVFDSSVRHVSRFTYMPKENMLYFLAERIGSNKEGALCRVEFRNGVAVGQIEQLVTGMIANYAIDDRYICYNRDGYNGIFRINHDGSNRVRLSRHEVQAANPAVRMHIDDGILFYINKEDHMLWTVPLNAQDDQQARLFIERPMHYYIVAPYKRAGKNYTEEIIIYVEYARGTDALDKAHLAAVDAQGNYIPELEHLRSIQSRYINYYEDTLYYVDFSVSPMVPRWVRLDGSASGSIGIRGQGDLKAFTASDGTHWKFNNRVGYIHVFDGWLAMAELGDTFVYYNPRTGRSDITNGAGTDIWFVDLETMTSYRCRMAE